MRLTLRVPYAEKDAAKALGARWDAARKTWYVVDPADLTPFTQWLPPGAGNSSGGERSAAAPKKQAAQAISTGRTDFTLPDCGCSHVAPWMACEHGHSATAPHL